MTALLTRKINRGKWDASEGLAANEVAADAVTSDLRTTGNALSFWKCASNDIDALNETVLAVASAYDRLDRVDIAWVARADVVSAELTVKESPENARIAVESLREQHADIVDLDVVRLGKVGGLIQSAVTRSQCKRFDKQQVLKVIVAAVNDKRLNTDSLQEKLRDAVKAELQRGQGVQADQGGSKSGHPSTRQRHKGGAPSGQDRDAGAAREPRPTSTTEHSDRLPAPAAVGPLAAEKGPNQEPAAQVTSKRSRAAVMVKWFSRWFSRD